MSKEVIITPYEALRVVGGNAITCVILEDEQVVGEIQVRIPSVSEAISIMQQARAKQGWEEMEITPAVRNAFEEALKPRVLSIEQGHGIVR